MVVWLVVSNDRLTLMLLWPMEMSKSSDLSLGRRHMWDISETYMGHTWDISGIYLGHTWDISGTYLGHIWDISELFLGIS